MLAAGSFDFLEQREAQPQEDKHMNVLVHGKVTSLAEGLMRLLVLWGAHLYLLGLFKLAR